MRKYLLSAIALLGLLAPATAQINTVPQVGQISSIVKAKSYSATSIGLVPAASATDIFCISNGTSANISIRKITIGGTAGTAITTPFLIYQRSTADTGGTAATGLALPVATPLNPNDSAATAVLTAYTANPTVASNPVLMDAALVDLPVTTAAGGQVAETLNYGTATDFFSKGLDLPKGSALQYCVNLNGVSVSSGTLMINIQWTETN